MTDKSNITSLSLEDLAAEHSDDLAAQAIRWLAQMSRMRISVLLHELFEQIDDALFAAAEREPGNSNQNPYALGLREVRRQRQAVTDCFSTRMAQNFESFEQQGSMSVPAEEATGATADPEINLAFAEMQSKAEALCFRALNELNQHLGELRDESPVQLTDNPLAPGNICQCFEYALGLITTEAMIKLTICKNFDRYVVSQIQFVLDFVNDELRKLAKLKESAKPKRQHTLFATIKTLLASKRIASQQEKYEKQHQTTAQVDASTGVPATKRDTTEEALDRWFVEKPEDKAAPAVPVEPPVLDTPAAPEAAQGDSQASAQEPEAVLEPTLLIVEHKDEMVDEDDELLPELIIEPPQQPLGSIESVLNDEWIPEIEAEFDQEAVTIDTETISHDQSNSHSIEIDTQEQESATLASAPDAGAKPKHQPKPLRLPPLPPLAEGDQRYIFTGDILAILERMQLEANAEDSENATPIGPDVGDSTVKQKLLSQLAQCREEYSSAEFSEEDEGTIDLVDLVFDFVLHDHNLPGPLQAMLAHLQVPYLRVALLDWQLFALADHPARKLLDELARAALGWSAETDNDREVYRRIEMVMHRIMNDYSGKQETFAQLFDSFGRYMHRFERRALESEKLALQALQQRERLKALKQSTVAIGQLMAGKKLPEQIDELLRRTMPEVMVTQWLNHGADSVQWQESRALVEDLIESVAVSPDPAGLAELETLLPIMSIRLHDSLDALDFDQRQKDQLFEQLDQMYEDLLGEDFKNLLVLAKDSSEPSRLTDTDVSGDTALETTVDEESVTEDDEDDIDFYEAAQLILGATREEADEAVSEESLHEALAGSWFEFKDDQGQSIRAKLSWAKPVGSKYLFVDQNGETITDKTLTELAAEVKVGKAMILESIPLFERALGAIADRLQREEPSKGD